MEQAESTIQAALRSTRDHLATDLIVEAFPQSNDGHHHCAPRARQLEAAIIQFSEWCMQNGLSVILIL